MVNQRELQQKAQRLEAMKNQVETMQGQKEMIQERIERHDVAKKTMKKYQEQEEGTEVLVPIGADSYLHTKVSNSEEVMIGLGSELTAERKIGDALEVIDRKKEKIKEEKEELGSDIEEMKNEAEDLEKELQQEYQQLQKQQQQGQQQQGGGQVFQ